MKEHPPLHARRYWVLRHSNRALSITIVLMDGRECRHTLTAAEWDLLREHAPHGADGGGNVPLDLPGNGGAEGCRHWLTAGQWRDLVEDAGE